MRPETARFLPPDTPDWILEFIESMPHGGWFIPFPVGEGHPLVAEGWLCLYCQEFFEPGTKAFVQPFHGTGEAKWVATHHPCMAEALGIEDQANGETA